MAKDNVQNTTMALNGIPFDNLIASPLNACVNAQAQAAYTTMKFINDVGLETKTVDGNEVKDAVYVYFTYNQGGQSVQISVPLLTIVPIPYIAIETVDINFTLTVNGIETSSNEDNDSEIENENSSDYKRSGIFKKEVHQLRTSVSTKRDSKSTQDSQFSIEATMDVKVHAKSDSMPAGMAKVLEIFNNSIDIKRLQGAPNPIEVPNIEE